MPRVLAEQVGSFRLLAQWFGLPRLPALIVGSLSLLCGCDSDPVGPSDLVQRTWDFTNGTDGFQAGFADYPPADEAIYRLRSDYLALPPPLDTSRRALFISGVNRSDDLFMFYKRRVGGLAPAVTYRASFDIEIATNVPNGCVGVGGAPGEAVWIKAGASREEPLAVDEGGQLRMNIDKGNQATGGENALVLGDIANSVPCGEPERWELKPLASGGESVTVTADQEGSVWILVGSDSGFESLTALYYTRVTANFDPT